MTPESGNQQGAAFGPPLLGLKHITKLCEAAMHMFDVLYVLERATKEANKVRLAAEFAALDALAPEPNHEDYTPGGEG